ncbi:tRNA (adenine(37)-N6)-methyltransferase [Parachlamydia sp. AcF125]|nr:tRNA (adenine(37)-N6)-methyltransferase [Parachlamydia sp. AcF125]
MQFKPIGYFFSSQHEKYMVPRQAELGSLSGYVLLEPGQNFDQAVEDLAGFERIWLIYCFHLNHSWKPKVKTPRGGQKRGVFATRSPHRPNPIGLSCVELLAIQGRKLMIAKSDLLNETPILDIKPYICYADAFLNIQQGWAGDSKPPNPPFSIKWSPLAIQQAAFIAKETSFDLQKAIEFRLSDNPYPFPNHRITHISENRFILACKTWRIQYTITDFEIFIEFIYSGYDPETLAGLKPSKWEDVYLHRKFIQIFCK